ncbi:MAG: DNA primase [Azospirillum sp.]|nr:DNA primase [Azospirillum sp.]
MAFPPQFLDELRLRLGLSEIVSKRLRLTRAGREFKAPCPFHNEKTPSFTVNDQKGFFHCFGCGAHGDVIGFVMRHDNLSFLEAVEHLAAEAGLAVPRPEPEDRERHDRIKRLHDLVEAAAGWFELQLRQAAGRAALAYLQSRGLGDGAIARFRLGYAPGDGAQLRLHLASLGFPVAEMIEAGLVRQPDDGRPAYAFFRNRAIFPVADRQGRVVAFGGRILDGEGPKYINSAETPLFHKGQLLYGLSRARQAAADGAPVVVAEGYMDVIALVEAGFGGAVAPLGTALTETQIQALWRLLPGREKAPILCFDGDNAGRRAAARAVERVLPLLAPDQTIRVAFLPDGQDPDSLIRQGGVRAMQTVLDRAQPLAEVLWDLETAGRRFDTPESRAGLRAALDARVDQVAERTVQEFYRRDMHRRVSEAFAWRRPERPEWRKDRLDRPAASTRHAVPRRRRPNPADQRRERLLLATLINHPMLFDEVEEALAQFGFSSPPLDDLRQAVVQLLGRSAATQSGLDGASLKGHLCAQGFDTVLNELLSQATYVDGGFSRPGASLEQARAGWWEAWQHFRGKVVKKELHEADRALGRDTSEINFVRMDALRREVVRVTSSVGDQSDGDDDGGEAGQGR